MAARHSFLLFICCLFTVVSAQRFLRQGFSNQEDFRSEMELDNKEDAADMTREMYLMKELPWELQPLTRADLSHLNPSLRRHLHKYLSQPIQVQLLKKRGKHGLRAVGQMPNGKKIRAYWRPAVMQVTRSDLTQLSYDEAIRARLFTVELELQLPPVSRQTKSLPSVVYQLSVESGSVNPKALVPRGVSNVMVYAAGRGASECTKVGSAWVGTICQKPGLVDPGWAKGRPIFRCGQKAGLF